MKSLYSDLCLKQIFHPSLIKIVSSNKQFIQIQIKERKLIYQEEDVSKSKKNMTTLCRQVLAKIRPRILNLLEHIQEDLYAVEVELIQAL